MSKLFAMAVPVSPGKVEQWKKFANQLNTNRKAEFAANRKKLEVRERTFLQQTPHGSMVIVTLEGENPQQAFQNFAKGTDEFTKWFVGEVKSIHDMDLTQPPPGA